MRDEKRCRSSGLTYLISFKQYRYSRNRHPGGSAAATTLTAFARASLARTGDFFYIINLVTVDAPVDQQVMS